MLGRLGKVETVGLQQIPEVGAGMLVQNVKQLDEVAYHLAWGDVGVGADAPVFYLDEVGQVLLVECAGVAVQVGVHGGQLLRQHEHLLARERLQPYHRG